MKSRTWVMGVTAVVAGLASPVAAHAQSTAGQVSAGARPASGFGVEFLAGGGYSNFVGSAARSSTGGAGTWDFRLVVGSRLPVGFEAAYVGSAQDLNVTGFNSGAYLLGNGAEGAVRFALPITRNQWFFAPFVTAGLGWNYYSLQSTGVNSALYVNHDSNLTIPVAAGVQAVYQGFTMQVRGTYRATTDSNLFGNTDLSTWGVTASLGFEF
jgi:hypothetical protein